MCWPSSELKRKKKWKERRLYEKAIKDWKKKNRKGDKKI